MLAVAPDLQPGLHPGRGRVQGEVELDLVDQERGRPIVGQVDRLWDVSAHAVV